MFYFPFKNNFFLRETRDGLGAFSGADLSRARFLTRSSKTLDREHRWNNAGLQKARVEWGKKWKEKRLRLRTPNWSGPSEISNRAWFSPEECKQLYTATRQRVREPEKSTGRRNICTTLCYSLRNKIGLDVAIEALRDCLRQKKASVNEIYRYAKVCRVSNVIRPYMEAL
jgi:hypothetical protein